MSSPVTPNSGNQVLFYVPALAATAAFGFLKVGGIISYGLAKATGKIVGCCSETLGKNIDSVGDKLISAVTKNPKSEIATILTWTFLGAVAHGATSLNENQEMKEYLGLESQLSQKDLLSVLSNNSLWLTIGPVAGQLLMGAFSGNTKTTEVKSDNVQNDKQSEPTDSDATSKENEKKEISDEEEKKATEEMKKPSIILTDPERDQNRFFIDRSQGAYFGEQHSVFVEETKNGLLANGRGKFKAFDKTKYEGWFEYNQFMNGTITFSNGQQVKHSLFDNNIIMIDRSKGKYIGQEIMEPIKRQKTEWISHGKGVFSDRDGTIYEGLFEHNELISGTITYPDGRVVTLNPMVNPPNSESDEAHDESTHSQEEVQYVAQEETTTDFVQTEVIPEYIEEPVYADDRKGRYMGEQNEDGFANGEGTFTTWNGTMYTGMFSYDEFISGTIRYPDGRVKTK